jgi:hypothetical protein
MATTPKKLRPAIKFNQAISLGTNGIPKLDTRRILRK